MCNNKPERHHCHKPKALSARHPDVKLDNGLWIHARFDERDRLEYVFVTDDWPEYTHRKDINEFMPDMREIHTMLHRSADISFLNIVQISVNKLDTEDYL